MMPTVQPMVTVEEMGRVLQHFSAPDYLVFVLMLIVCAAIGIYFGFVQKAVSAEDYLVGGRKMTVIPISLSLIARYENKLKYLVQSTLGCTLLP